MVVTILSSQTGFQNTGHDIVRLFFPEAKVIHEITEASELILRTDAHLDGRLLVGVAEILENGHAVDGVSVSSDVCVSNDIENNQKRLIKLAMARVLMKHTSKPLGPWGILTGIRPTKIVHRLLDEGYDNAFIKEFLLGNYDVNPLKADLLLGIATRQRNFLLNRQQADNLVSIYIGIPFCPTRCAYCSFPAYAVDRWGHLLAPFLEALEKEISGVAQALRESEKKVQTLYIGGGTPTTFDAYNLNRLLEHVARELITDSTREVTLEAGRPDTITKEKLLSAKTNGVTRLSINPQTMNRNTLLKIGRCHTPDDIIKANELVRNFDFHCVNMDLILGLPGENNVDLEKTLEEVLSLKPENITVHTLAVKRASQLKENLEGYDLPEDTTVAEMLSKTYQNMGRFGLTPYYLYRQKNMIGQLENVGFTVPGYECEYNIQMIEERETIIGLGGGSGSKFLEPGTWYLKNDYNPKDPETYIRRVQEITDIKKEIIKNL